MGMIYISSFSSLLQKGVKQSVHHSLHLIRFIIYLFKLINLSSQFLVELVITTGTSSDLVLACVEKLRTRQFVLGPSSPIFLCITVPFKNLSSFLGSNLWLLFPGTQNSHSVLFCSNKKFPLLHFIHSCLSAPFSKTANGIAERSSNM